MFGSVVRAEENAACKNIYEDELIVKLKDSNKFQDRNTAPNYYRKLDRYNRKKVIKMIRQKTFSFSVIRSETLTEENLYAFKLKVAPFLSLAKMADPNIVCNSLLDLAAKLEDDPSIELVEPDYIYNSSASTVRNVAQIKNANLTSNKISIANDSSIASNLTEWVFDYDALWGLNQIKAPSVWSKTQGAPIVVAVLDTGVNYNHADLWDSIWVNPNTVPDRNRDGRRTLDDVDLNQNNQIDSNEIKGTPIGYNSASRNSNPYDSDGHGTHVAGIIAAQSGNNLGIAGAAPQARILVVRVFDDHGVATTKSLIRGLRYAVKKKAQIVNLSLGSVYYDKALDKFFQKNAHKVLFVAAAGNNRKDVSGYSFSTVFYPASYNNVMSIAAGTQSMTKVFTSNYGITIDIMAPGGAVNGLPNILSTDSSGAYKLRSGTSMAAPYVAAAAALLLSANPHLQPEQLKNILRYSAKRLSVGFAVGAGLLDTQTAFTTKGSFPYVRLLMPEYAYPNPQSIRGVQPIYASMFGSDLKSYELYLARGLELKNFSLINSGEAYNGKRVLLYRAFDANLYSPGIYTLRLVVKNHYDEYSYDDVLINIIR